MPTDAQISAKQKSHKPAREKPLKPQGAWKPAWIVLWGLLSTISELALIFLTKEKILQLTLFQVLVLFICIPLVVHLVISLVRKFLILASIS